VRRSQVLVSLVAVATLLSACAASPRTTSGWTDDGSPFSAVSRAPVLATSPVAGLAASATAVDAQTIAGETTLTGISAALTAAGFVGGRQREYQGPSRDLSLVLSRGLVFDSGVGAQGYLDFVHQHAEDLFGLTTTSAPLTVGNAVGWAFTAPECACPGAQPRVIGVVRDGTDLRWLVINGPRADASRLATLLAEATATT
jgi:hypothetical protein